MSGAYDFGLPIVMAFILVVFPLGAVFVGCALSGLVSGWRRK